jgi:hypothetical protein
LRLIYRSSSAVEAVNPQIHGFHSRWMPWSQGHDNGPLQSARNDQRKQNTASA